MMQAVSKRRPRAAHAALFLGVGLLPVPCDAQLRVCFRQSSNTSGGNPPSCSMGGVSCASRDCTTCSLDSNLGGFTEEFHDQTGIHSGSTCEYSWKVEGTAQDDMEYRLCFRQTQTGNSLECGGSSTETLLCTEYNSSAPTTSYRDATGANVLMGSEGCKYSWSIEERPAAVASKKRCRIRFQGTTWPCKGVSNSWTGFNDAPEWNQGYIDGSYGTKLFSGNCDYKWTFECVAPSVPSAAPTDAPQPLLSPSSNPLPGLPPSVGPSPSPKTLTSPTSSPVAQPTSPPVVVAAAPSGGPTAAPSCTGNFMSNCADCLPGYYGPDCDLVCPRDENTTSFCNGHATCVGDSWCHDGCSDGKSGDGSCHCDPEWLGAQDCSSRPAEAAAGAATASVAVLSLLMEVAAGGSVAAPLSTVTAMQLFVLIGTQECSPAAARGAVSQVTWLLNPMYGPLKSPPSAEENRAHSRQSLLLVVATGSLHTTLVVITWLIMRSRGWSFGEAKEALMFPNLLVLIFGLLLLSSVSSGVAVAFDSESPILDRLLSCLLVSFYVLATPLWLFKFYRTAKLGGGDVSRRAEYVGRNVPNSKSNAARVVYTPRRALAMPTALVWFLPAGFWTSQHLARRGFCKRYNVLFDEYCAPRHWFLAVQVARLSGYAVVMGLSSWGCTARLISALGLTVLYFIAIVLLRPYSSRGSNILHSIVALTTSGVVGACIAVGDGVSLAMLVNTIALISCSLWNVAVFLMGKRLYTLESVGNADNNAGGTDGYTDPLLSPDASDPFAAWEKPDKGEAKDPFAAWENPSVSKSGAASKPTASQGRTMTNKDPFSAWEKPQDQTVPAKDPFSVWEKPAADSAASPPDPFGAWEKPGVKNNTATPSDPFGAWEKPVSGPEVHGSASGDSLIRAKTPESAGQAISTLQQSQLTVFPTQKTSSSIQNDDSVFQDDPFAPSRVQKNTAPQRCLLPEAEASHVGQVRMRFGSEWREYWAEVRGDFLCYYKESSDAEPQGKIPLRGASVSKVLSAPCAVGAPPGSARIRSKGAQCILQSDDIEGWMAALADVVRDQFGGDGPQLSEARLVDWLELDVLGVGAFGEVRRCRRVGTITPHYALKKVRGESDNETMGEIAVLQLLCHPFVVRLEDAFRDGGTVCLVLQLLPGGDLNDHIKDDGCLSPDTTKYFAAEVLLALEHLHANSILYRDLKPANVVLDEEGHAVLTDMGIAQRGLVSGEFCGTPYYLAPEVIAHRTYNERVDWWAFGVLIFEMLSGNVPFKGSDPAITFQLIRVKAPSYPVSTPPAAKDLMQKLLRKKPQERLSNPRKIRKEGWFKGLDWDLLVDRKLPTPDLGRKRLNEDTTALTKGSIDVSLADNKLSRSLFRSEADETNTTGKARQPSEMQMSTTLQQTSDLLLGSCRLNLSTLRTPRVGLGPGSPLTDSHTSIERVDSPEHIPKHNPLGPPGSPGQDFESMAWNDLMPRTTSAAHRNHAGTALGAPSAPRPKRRAGGTSRGQPQSVLGVDGLRRPRRTNEGLPPPQPPGQAAPLDSPTASGSILTPLISESVLSPKSAKVRTQKSMSTANRQSPVRSPNRRSQTLCPQVSTDDCGSHTASGSGGVE
eukprot:Hpha_TRINITY_DN13020_c0_g1::TRINITY_DN13020_c0_g1_i1::g.68982::m.68982